MEALYDSSGVDVSLIRWSLSLTPAERIERLQTLIEFFRDVWKRNGIEPFSGDTQDAR